MTLITLPAGFVFVDEEWNLDVPAERNQSEYTGHSKVVGLPGAETWTARLTVESVTTEIDDRAWRMFLLGMRGIQNECYVRPLEFQVPVTPGVPVVGAGPGNGYTAPITGITAGATPVLGGQFLTFILPSGHRRMVCLMGDLVANGGGNAVATFEPSLGEVPTPGSAVEMTNPYCRMRFVDRKQGWRTVDGISTHVLDFEEAL